MRSAATTTSGPVLPALRQELRLCEGPSGGPERCWLIYDPIRHRYFQVSHGAFQIIERWHAQSSTDLAARCQRELDRPVSAAEIEEIAAFIRANSLAVAPLHDDPRMLARQETASRRSLVGKIVHNYLFFRVPIVRPERFLRATMPLASPLYSRSAAILLCVVTMIGLYFASRQWELFVATFLDFLSFEGALVYGVTLLAVKSLHELGHAYTATRLGVRVNTMGVAFMVLAPILYTDVTDAWRLRDRRDKLAIDAAGIAVELALAGISIFLWAFLPDGPLRSAAFVTATTSLIMGLLINLNPLMRFDGYHLLADAVSIPNLQSRSNDLAVWWLRECLFGLGHWPPEAISTSQRSLMILYAFCVWIYRFFLFIAIALIVYHMFFKALGIILFAVEIIWFILLPIGKEIREWWKMRAQIAGTPRSLLTTAIAAAALVVIMVPWSGTVTVQAVALSDHETRIFAPRAARVVAVEVRDATTVTTGQPLIVLRAPDLDFEVVQARRQIELARVRLDRIAGDEADRSNRIVLEGELLRHQTSLAGLEAEQGRLTVVSPHDGVARDVDLDLQPGEWINEAMPIARIVQNTSTQIHGYVSEHEVWRIAEGSDATFVPEDPLLARRHGHVTNLVQTGMRTLELPYLASIYGGAVASDRSPDGEIKPRSGRHLISVRVEGAAVDRAVRGTLHISGKPESIAARIWQRVLQVLVRESSA